VEDSVEARKATQDAEVGAVPGQFQAFPGLAIGLYEFFSDALFTVAAVVDILLARIGTFEGIIIIIVFVLFGMVGLWIPIFVRIVSPEKSATRLESMRQWLLANAQMILVFEFVCLGVIEALKGLVGLL